MKASLLLKIKNHTHSILSFLISAFICFNAHTQPVAHFNFDAHSREAFHLILQLKLDKASEYIKLRQQAQPNNLAYDFITDYIDLLKIYISDDKALFKKLEANEKSRISVLSTQTGLQSPFTKYAQAEIYLHWALLHLKFGHYLAGFNRIKKANNLLEENVKLYPSFTPNQKSLAMIHAMMSTIPQEYKWIVKTLSGISGNMDQARFELEQVILYADKSDYIFKDEAVLTYILLVTNFDNDLQSALNMLKKSKIDPTKSPLSSYLFAHLAVKTYQNDLALKYLEERPTSNEYFPFPYLDFLTGLAKLRKLDYKSKYFLEKYIANHRGTHYVKECYQKLAWNELIHKNIQGYNYYISLCKSNGASIIDEDKQAIREANQNLIPNVELLQARLLFDGGYFNDAQSVITKNQLHLNKNTALEANYRLARILHLEKKYDQAITNYLLVINTGSDHPEYYACASALYLGQLFELLNKIELAKSYFERCLKLSPKDYSSSLHQKAKAGLNRLN